MTAHHAESTSSNKTQCRLGKLVNPVNYDRYVASLERSPRRHPRGAQATHTGRRRREVAPKAGKEVNRDQVPLPFLGHDRSSRLGSIERRDSCPRDGAFWGERSSRRPGAPAPVRRTRTRGMRICAIDGARRSTSTSPRYTRTLPHT